jgi:hypothetical protein
MPGPIPCSPALLSFRTSGPRWTGPFHAFGGPRLGALERSSPLFLFPPTRSPPPPPPATAQARSGAPGASSAACTLGTREASGAGLHRCGLGARITTLGPSTTRWRRPAPTTRRPRRCSGPRVRGSRPGLVLHTPAAASPRHRAPRSRIAVPLHPCCRLRGTDLPRQGCPQPGPTPLHPPALQQTSTSCRARTRRPLGAGTRTPARRPFPSAAAAAAPAASPRRPRRRGGRALHGAGPRTCVGAARSQQLARV